MILQKNFFNFNLTSFTNLIFAFFPLSFVFGNLFLNVNLLLFCLLGTFCLKSKIYSTELNTSLKIIFLFFFIIFLSTCLSLMKSIYFENYEDYDLTKFLKSIGFFRFYLMLLIIYFLAKFDILKFKYFFLSGALTALIISLDVIFQYIAGFNMVGFKSLGTHNSGLFGEELIAGGFINKFSFFSIFLLAFTFNNKKIYKFIFTILGICILGTGILLSGNRMPLILFLFGLLLFFVFKNNFKKIIFISFFALFSIFTLISSMDHNVKMQFLRFQGNSKLILSNIWHIADNNESKIFLQKKETLENDWGFAQNYISRHKGSSHMPVFISALDIWKKNIIFGNGIKSFRKDCQKIPLHTNRLCSNHPHNYYIEILTETGIVGLSITFLVIFLFIVFIFKNFSFLNSNNMKSIILLVATMSLLVEIFPLKTTGSIFSTANASYLMLIVSILLSYKKLREI